jgi:hypothetical protein
MKFSVCYWTTRVVVSLLLSYCCDCKKCKCWKGWMYVDCCGTVYNAHAVTKQLVVKSTNEIKGRGFEIFSNTQVQICYFTESTRLQITAVGPTWQCNTISVKLGSEGRSITFCIVNKVFVRSWRMIAVSGWQNTVVKYCCNIKLQFGR